jgi:polyisoprenoid-binding protein YceI
MTVSSGTHSLGPQAGKITVNVYREGVAAKMGHDLVLEATKWSGKADVNADDPSASSVEVTVDPTSLEIIGAKGGAKPLSDKDKADIKKNINEKILQTSKHREITFKSSETSGSAPNVKVKGNLTLVGNTQPITLDVKVDESSGRVSGKITFQQSSFGIKPFSAMLGALKIKDSVEIEFDVEIPS